MWTHINKVQNFLSSLFVISNTPSHVLGSQNKTMKIKDRIEEELADKKEEEEATAAAAASAMVWVHSSNHRRGGNLL